MSIPKVIHYCWFGKSEPPVSVKKCIASWKKHCPGYEIKRWDETNVDINENLYAKQAYEAGKWAFGQRLFSTEKLYMSRAGSTSTPGRGAYKKSRRPDRKLRRLFRL